MADVISRLKLDSGEFDSKIKRAGQELMAYSEHCKKMGLEMGYANKDAKDFAKALGSMQTTSSSARGKINELTEAFVNLKVMYKNMTDEEKNNTFGKNLAASLDQLKTRIDQAKAELNDVNKELGNTKQAEVDTKGGLEGLTNALGINIKTLAGWGTAIAAGKVALDVAKDAFFASESTVDEWGRTVAASQSLYEGFLTAINNGDISGYLSNIDSIVKAARLAYDELDKLGTMKTIQAPQISKQQTENERIRSMIQTGRYIAPQDGRKNAVFNGREMQAGDKLTAGQIRALEKQLQGGMQKMVKLVGNEVDQTGKAINAYYDKLAKTNGMSLQEFKKGTSSWEEFSKKMQGYEQYKEWDKQARSEFAKQGGRGNVDFDKNNPFAEFRKWGTFRVDKEGDNSYKDLVALIQQRDQQVGQVYSTQAQAYRTMNRAEGVTVRQIMGDTGGKGGNGGTTDKNLDDEQKVQAKINDLLKEALTADAHRQGEIRQQVAELQKQQEKYKDIKNIAQGILPKDKEAVFTIDGQLTEETKKALSDIKGVTIDDKSLTITANTSDALKALQGIEGVTIDQKTVTITATDEALPKLREIEGITIDDKTMTVTANTADALRALQGIEGVTIDPKSVTITATDEALPKLREIQGITIDDKTMTVTAETADALRALQAVEGVTIAPKSVTITATDEALPKLREIQGITIDDKTMTVTAETSDALRALQGIEGVTIAPKTVTITATDEALPKLREIQGITIDDKSLTITVNTSDALKALQGIEGVTINPKSVTITATDEALPKLREIQGITIDNKTMTVTAETADALRALQAIEGVTIDPKTVTITATDEAVPKLREIQGITIDDKTMTVTADTQEAMQKVQELIGVVSETKLMPIKPVITDGDIDNLLRKQYGQAIEVPVTPKMSAGEELVQSIRLDLAQSIQDADMQTLRTLLEAQIKNGIEGVEIPANSIIDHIFGEESVNIPDEYWRNLQEQINEKLREMNIEELNIDFGTGKDNSKDKKESDKKESKEEKKYLSEGLSQLSGGLNGLQSGFSQLGIDLGDGFGSVVQGLSGISSILMAIQTIVGAIEAISAVDSIIPFANGGIVRAAGGTLVGNSYSGDNLRGIGPDGQIYGLNAGEVVLNRSQVGNLASQLSGSGLQGMKLDAVITGEQIRLVLNNNGRRTGRGEYVQTKSGRV